MKKFILCALVAFGTFTLTPSHSKADDCAYLENVIYGYLALSQGYEALGEHDAAEAHYNAAGMVYSAGLSIGCGDYLVFPEFAQAE